MTEKVDDPIRKDAIVDHRKTLIETIKQHLPNPTEIIIDQIIQMFIQWYNRRILIFSSLMMIIIPIYMISIGVIFIHACPKTIYLPLHMIICGMTSFISAILLIGISILWKQSIKFTSKSLTRIFSILEIIFISICLIGLIILTLVLIRISNTIEFNHQTSNYCHPILYYSSYILLFLFYILLSLIMLILFLIFHAYQYRK